MVDVRASVGSAMTPSFAYVQNLPEAIGSTISRAIEIFATKYGLQAEEWHQGLPVWIVKESNARVNRVQVDAVQYDGRSVVSFTPDAYQDKDESQPGVRQLRRFSADPSEILPHRRFLEYTQLLDRHSPGEPASASGDAFDLVFKVLDETLEQARRLPLRIDGETVAYPTPFAL